MKKNVAIAMAITAGLCFAGSGHLKPAFAGHWEEVPNPYAEQFGFWGPAPNDPDYQKWLDEQHKRLDGQITINGTDYVNGIPQAQSETRDWGKEIWYNGPYHTIFTPRGGPYSTTSSGQVSSVFRWIPGNPNDTNPSPLHLKGHFWVSAVVNSGTNRDASKESTTTSINNEQWTGTDSGYSTQSFESKEFLFNVPLSSGSINQNTGYFEVQAPWTQLSSSGTIDFNGVNADIGGDINFYYEFAIDNRAVDISSSVEPTYHKGQDPLVPEINKRTPSGSVTADKVANWSDEFGEWVWGDTFQANLAGQWDDPQLEWSSGVGANPYNNIPSGYAAYLLGGTKESGPSSKTAGVKVTVNDDDGMLRMNTYNINFHAPYEKWTQENVYDIADEYFAPGDNDNRRVSAGLDASYTPVKHAYLNVGGALQGVSAAFALTATGVALIGTDGAALPAVLGGLSAITGYGSYTIGTPPPDPLQYVTADYGDFKESVQGQVALGPTVPYILYVPPELINPATGQYYTPEDVANQLGTNGNDDPFFNGDMGTCFGTLSAGTTMKHHDYVADTYSNSGYVGPGLGSDESPGLPVHYFSWDYEINP